MYTFIKGKVYELFQTDDTMKVWLIKKAHTITELPNVLNVFDTNGRLVTQLNLDNCMFSIDIRTEDGWLVLNTRK